MLQGGGAKLESRLLIRRACERGRSWGMGERVVREGEGKGVRFREGDGSSDPEYYFGTLTTALPMRSRLP